MSGLVDLVPVAELLAQLSGSAAGAPALALGILTRGEAALGRRVDDSVHAARRLLRNCGCVDSAGRPVSARAAELVTVCEILAATTPTPPPAPDLPRLVLSAPPGMAAMTDFERLGGLVLDTIRRSTVTLDLGGAFWNGLGFEQMNEVLLPALQVRGVRLTLYVNVPDKVAHRLIIDDEVELLRQAGDVTVYWFRGARPTMLHAKFVVADRCRGYLGTANLTSWGLDGRHIEAGVELFPHQAERLLEFCEQLRDSGLFTDNAPV